MLYLVKLSFKIDEGSEIRAEWDLPETEVGGG
jgi:hypothetical protein